MSKYIALTKVLLKNGNYSLEGDKKKKFKAIALALIVLAAFVPTIMLFVDFIRKAYDLLYNINQEGLILSTGIALVSVIIFFFGIFYSLNVMYFSKDIENLLPLPLKPWHVISAKFSTILVYEYITEVFISLPLLIVYGGKSHGNIIYYIYSIILFLTIPIVPLCICSIINIIIMKFVNVGKYKDKLKVLGGMAAVFIGIYLNVWIQKLQKSFMDEHQIVNMLEKGNNSLVNISDKIFPGTSMAAKSLIFSNNIVGLKSIIIYLILVSIIFLIFLFLGEKLYFKGVVGISETSSQRKELSNKALVKVSQKRSAMNRLIFKELKILFRTPVYFMNCVTMNFLWPVILLIPFFANTGGLKGIDKIVYLFNISEIKGFIAIISIALGMFISSSNLITSTAISREGQNLFISKYIPVNYKIQLMAKVLSGVIMSMTGIVIILVAVLVIFKIPIYFILLSLILCLLGVLFSSMVGIIIDLNFPKLNWDSEAKAVKQNLNGIISMIINIVLSAVLIALIINLKKYEFIINISVICIILILDYVLYKFIITKGIKLFKNIES